MVANYEVRIVGPVDETSLLALRDLEVTVVTVVRLTVLSGRLDQPALHGLLERIHVLGLRLEEVRRVRLPPSRRHEGSSAGAQYRKPEEARCRDRSTRSG